ncbi:hypothetical protein HK103_001390 [Boothiomyces macroporosus]|uniref:PX domain-containing protein n=1 Tax=Boothiomyces macroporosus TaxID=261099 RepID=A0AAD5UAF4_9FUNG|nr:hypothetical protein HK103_001390 [Boothiomyces macroporosus]
MHQSEIQDHRNPPETHKEYISSQKYEKALSMYGAYYIPYSKNQRSSVESKRSSIEKQDRPVILSRSSSVKHKNTFPGSRPLSPTESVSKRRNSLHSNRFDSGIELQDGKGKQSIFVQSLQLIDDEWMFTIEFKLLNGNSRIMFRAFSELWDMHNDILQECPIESGITGQPRSIPFMDAPNQAMDQLEVIRIRNSVNFYIQEIFMLSSLGIGSKFVNEMFSFRQGDITCQDKILNNSTTAIMDLLSDLTPAPQRTIVLTNGKRSVTWTEFGDLKIDEIMERARSTLGEHVFVLRYKNELGKKVVVQTDHELHLIMNFRPRVTLFVS